MHDLLFTLLGDAYPFPREVRVSWAADAFEFRLSERGLLVTADRSTAPHAREVLDAFLDQLTGESAV